MEPTASHNFSALERSQSSISHWLTPRRLAPSVIAVKPPVYVLFVLSRVVCTSEFRHLCHGFYANGKRQVLGEFRLATPDIDCRAYAIDDLKILVVQNWVTEVQVT